MAVGTRANRAILGRSRERGAQIGGLGFDWATIGGYSLLISGVFLDAWAHAHIRGTLESFFTPWHAMLYGGFTIASALLLGAVARNRARGASLSQAVPRGYALSVAGMLIFAAGGVGDLFWHTLFGMEVDIEATLSPSHLMLGLGAVLFMSGPFRSAWHRRDRAEGTWLGILPMLLSLSFALAIMSLLTSYVHPLGRLWPARYGEGQTGQSMGVASIMLQSALLMGWLLLVVRRWALPFGSLALLLGLNAAFVCIVHDEWSFVPLAALAGLIADALLWWLRPSAANALALRVFAFATPAIYFLLYFLWLAATEGIVWTVHLWGGAIVLAGFAGWTLSYLLVPPALPAEVEELRSTRRHGATEPM